MKVSANGLSFGATFGLMGIWPSFRGDGVASLMHAGLSDTFEIRNIHLLYVMFTLAISMVLAAKSSKVMPNLLRRPPHVLAASFIASAALLVLWAGDRLGIAAFPASACAVLVFGAWVAVQIPLWGSLSLTLGKFSSLATASVLGLILSLAPSTLGLAISREVFHVLTAASPVISGLAFCAVSRRAGRPIPDSPDSNGHASLLEYISTGFKKEESLRQMGLVIVLMLLAAIMRGLLNNGMISSQTPSDSLYTHGVTVVIAVLFALILIKKNRLSEIYSLLFISLSIIMLAGLFLLALINARDNTLSPLARGIIIGGRTCMGLLLWLMIATFAMRRPEKERPCLFVMYASVEAAAALISYQLLPAMSQYLNWNLPEHLFACSLAVAFLLVITCIYSLYRRGAGLSTSSSKMDLAELLALDISGRYHLTNRENDILVMLLRGHSVRRISELLGLSVNTVQGYSKSLYRKLGVHSRQEIIDLSSSLQK